MAKISVNTGEVKRNVRQISTAGNALAGKQDGLRQPNSSINTPTPKRSEKNILRSIIYCIDMELWLKMMPSGSKK